MTAGRVRGREQLEHDPGPAGGERRRVRGHRLPDALRALDDAPVLTVSDLKGFAEQGGMIGFRITQDGRVAFDINLPRVEKTGLRMSSQLLKLARIVRGP